MVYPHYVPLVCPSLNSSLGAIRYALEHPLSERRRIRATPARRGRLGVGILSRMTPSSSVSDTVGPVAASQDGHGVDVGGRYLDLLKGCLTRYLFVDEEVEDVVPVGWKGLALGPVERALGGRGIRLVKTGTDRLARELGRTWPSSAETMVGLRRLDHVQACVAEILREGVPGDLIETGVWRGGTTILMRAVLAAHGDTTRRVWVADSFQGLPRPDVSKCPADALDPFQAALATPAGPPEGAGEPLHEPGMLGKLVTRLGYARQDSEPGHPWATPKRVLDTLVVSLDEVKANFAKYGLLDDQVQFLPGWFRDTLPSAPMERLAVIRLDGDLYESTMDALVALYPKLSIGGWLIIDDYHCILACRQAVSDYRAAHGIEEVIEEVDWSAVCWKRLR